jgi:hypothetical protein
MLETNNIQKMSIHRDEWADWKEQCREHLRRPLKERLRAVWPVKRKRIPVLDDATYRSFETMEEYRTWCQQNLPEYLGYARRKV